MLFLCNMEYCAEGTSFFRILSTQSNTKSKLLLSKIKLIKLTIQISFHVFLKFHVTLHPCFITPDSPKAYPPTP